MDGLLQGTNVPAKTGSQSSAGFGLEEVRAICTQLEEHKAGAVVALDLRELQLWTDYFIIATVSSSTHLQGLLRHITGIAAREGYTLFNPQKKTEENGGWLLVDMGTAVIHLMTAQTREFYELEELWSSSRRIYPS